MLPYQPESIELYICSFYIFVYHKTKLFCSILYSTRLPALFLSCVVITSTSHAVLFARLLLADLPQTGSRLSPVFRFHGLGPALYRKHLQFRRLLLRRHLLGHQFFVLPFGRLLGRRQFVIFLRFLTLQPDLRYRLAYLALQLYKRRDKGVSITELCECVICSRYTCLRAFFFWMAIILYD